LVTGSVKQLYSILMLNFDYGTLLCIVFDFVIMLSYFTFMASTSFKLADLYAHVKFKILEYTIYISVWFVDIPFF